MFLKSNIVLFVIYVCHKCFSSLTLLYYIINIANFNIYLNTLQVPVRGCNFWKDNGSDEDHVELDYLEANFDTPVKGKFRIFPIARFFSQRGC